MQIIEIRMISSSKNRVKISLDKLSWTKQLSNISKSYIFYNYIYLQRLMVLAYAKRGDERLDASVVGEEQHKAGLLLPRDRPHPL